MWKCHIREFMAKNKMDNVNDLMCLSGLSRNAINKLYKEKNLETINMSTIKTLCDLFKCSSSELLEYIPDDNNSLKKA